MRATPAAAAVRGATMRWTWTEGPTRGKTHEHIFHQDGTVEWHDAGAPADGAKPGSAHAQRPLYAAIGITPEIYLVSYLAASGFTLTVTLDFTNSQLTGIASSAKEWYPVRGYFEIVD